MKLYRFLIFISTFFVTNTLLCQAISASYINELKQDVRGPYQAIKWFCPDGTMRHAKDPCPEPMEGVQHAIYKDKVKRLYNSEHLFLDQILTGTEYEDFWDEDNNNSRLKQYQITNFLYDADNGWILEKAKTYRGAKQIEDEKEWGNEFLLWLLKDRKKLKENFALIRLAARDIPHGEDTRVAQRVRAYSKLLADENSDFMNERIKLHNNPSADDLDLVENWKQKNDKLSAKAEEYLDKLLTDMRILYKPFEVSDLTEHIQNISNDDIKKHIGDYIDDIRDSSPGYRARKTTYILKYIREHIAKESKATGRLALIDLSNELENVVMQSMHDLDEKSLLDIQEKICYLTEGMYGSGYIESWEYEKIKNDLDWLQGRYVSMEGVDYYKYATQKLVLWSSQMLQSLYVEPIHKFAEFESLVHGYVDDKVRSSLILTTGQVADRLNEFFNEKVNNGSAIMGNKNISGNHGLNPGIAMGTLYVLSTLSENAILDKNAIYAFDRPPADMKPVAGILNVQEGNPVSHVQLLARNLGIPNALISSETLNSLDRYNGKEVFYAVSPKGAIVLKKASDMSEEEKDLFKGKKKINDKITISTDQIKLHPDSLLDLSKIDASFSGLWCGPKAANLGQLKQMFPKHVVDGFVIPFGIFKDHMLQKIPGKSISYWEYLKKIFEQEQQMIAAGKNSQDIETQTLSGLSQLQDLIKKMPLKKEFINNVENHFSNVLGKEIGKIPVFLRSDTNMEDLPEFTGAGLNLTLFNVVDREKILNGIKKVWASPYTERSYQWRQQYLNNPEDVYPSILIIPSVNVDRSGVIITKGVSRGGDEDISISFSRGVGGAVEGQSAESYVLYSNGYNELISPGRETKYRTIPPSGGSTFKYTSFSNPVLTDNMLDDLKVMAQSISDKMHAVTGKENVAYDIELGIKDDFITLFQVRPFVENKDALGSDYLKKLDPDFEKLFIYVDDEDEKK